MWKKENLRKNFLRVKQLADQNLGRSEKSEVLTEDLLTIEKRVEIVKTVCQNISKKLSSGLQAQGDTVEKRLKKLPETSLAHCLNEASALLGTGTESLLGQICQLCGEAQNNLAREQLQYEINIEKDVLGPLQSIFDVDLPAISKARKHLTKTTLDMDSAKGRHTTAVRQSQLPGTNIANASAKVDQIKEELEEAETKVEFVKDSLAIEMSNFIAKETEHSQKLLALVEAQAAYHEKALQAIQAVIPKMQRAIENNPTKPVFGNCLEEHLRVTGRDIAVVLEACVVTLLYTGMNEEGLFRIAGAASKLKKLKACFDANIVDMEEFRHDPHTVAGTLKQYLRELPEPLLTYNLYVDFMQAATLPKDKIVSALKPIIEKLPPPNYNNFRYLIKFLEKLCKSSDQNKMTPTNIAIVIAPNLLWSDGENAPNMLTTGSLSTIIEAVVSNAEYFFPGDIDFTKTKKGSAPAMSKENVNSSTNEQDKNSEQSPSLRSVSRQSSNRNSRLDFYNQLGQSATNSQSSFHGDLLCDRRSESVSESSDILLDNNLSCDNLSLDDSLSATEEIDFQNVGEHTPPSMSPVTTRDLRTSEPETTLASQVSTLLAPQAVVRPVSPAPISPSGSSGNIQSSLLVENQSPEQPGASPKAQRRMPKKSAPPPPPDRPYSVAVTATVNKPTSNLYQTWPRHQGAPLASPETGHPELDPLEEVTSARPTIPDRPPFPTRQGSHPPERPERPKAPPPSVPQGHNRSSSTGGMIVPPPQPNLQSHNSSSNGQDIDIVSEDSDGEMIKSISAL